MKKIILPALLTLVLTIMPTMEIQAGCNHMWKGISSGTDTYTEIHNCIATEISDGTVIHYETQCTITHYVEYTVNQCEFCDEQRTIVTRRYSKHSVPGCIPID
ncbi:hypothetical protein AN1V17_41870 [Vallitalea sediminicola]